MTTNKKPRKPYRPRPVTAHTMTLAVHYAAKTPAAERAEVLDALRIALRALREGVATEHQWSIAAGAVAVAQAIERQRVVRGLHDHLASADQALNAIKRRALDNGGGQWQRATLYYEELDVLQAFFDLHSYQMAQLSRAEFLAAIDEATKQIAKDGHTVQQVRDIANMTAHTVSTGNQAQRMAA